MTNTKQIREELGHDGLVLWQPFKNWAMARNWNLDDMSPNELDEYYALFKAGHDHGQQALVAENQALRQKLNCIAFYAKDHDEPKSHCALCLIEGVVSGDILPIETAHGGNDE